MPFRLKSFIAYCSPDPVTRSALLAQMLSPPHLQEVALFLLGLWSQNRTPEWSLYATYTDLPRSVRIFCPVPGHCHGGLDFRFRPSRSEQTGGGGWRG